MFLIDHPEGLVVFDTGLNADHLPDEMKGEVQYTSEMRIDRQMVRLGYEPSDVRYVVLSHMHADHAGGMSFFPDATFIIRKEELRAAWWPETCDKGYLFADYRDTRDYKYVQPEDDVEVDLFSDGSLVLFDTRGHSRGHQSAIVTLPESGPIVLAADSLPVRENLRSGCLPGICWNNEMAARSIEKLQHMEREGMKIILGHDLESFKELRIAPQYYG
jgi:glyoxylase-like metal-dependent hydrolase (beta-lactamase superfamily II)